jgi:hypothetical protein
MRKFTEKYLGQKFGRLLVEKALPLERVGNRWNRYYECKCDCGQIKKVRLDALKPGGTKSCGCLQKEIAQSFCHEVFTKLPNGEKPFNDLWSAYRRSARIRQIDFSLNKDEFRVLVVCNCYYCNRPPQSKYQNKRFADDYFIYNGIDRIDSAMGYSVENCVTCCADCNYAKGSLSQENFLDLIRKIYHHRANDSIS